MPEVTPNRLPNAIPLSVQHAMAQSQALSSRIATLNEIANSINRKLDVGEIQQVVSEQVKWLLDFEHCSLCMRQPNGSYQITTLFGMKFDMETDITLLADNDPLKRALVSGQQQIVMDGDTSAPGLFDGFFSLLVTPLTSDEGVFGALNFGSKQHNLYTLEDCRISYLLAVQLSLAIRNAERFQTIQRYAAELEARNRELDAYNHTIAHDLKTPLTQIIWNADLVMSRHANVLPDDAIARLQRIEDTGETMARMIDSLLQLATLRDNAVQPVVVDVNEVVRETLGRFQQTLEQQHILFTVDAQLPPALGHGPWLAEIFANLIGNAIKYMGSANTAPSIAIRGRMEQGMVRFEVKDNGVGIAPENQTRLFEMFTRLHTVEAKGFGLGLSIVQRMVTKLNGQVGVESEFGAGSTFWFTLPAPKEALGSGC